MTRKRKADLILLAVAFCFAGASAALYYHPVWWTRLLFYMTEAGLVGGLADWYAVTALFRHPLGIKNKHTAIIPRNRAKLIDGVVTMVETQLLPSERLKEKLAELSIMNTVIEWIDDRYPRGTLGAAGWKWATALLAKLDFSRAAQNWDEQLKQVLQRTDITPYAGKGLNALLKSGNIHYLIDQLVILIEKKTSEPETRAFILQILQQEHEKQLNSGNAFTRFLKKAASIFAEESDALNLQDAADALYRDLGQFIQDFKRHDHELRLLLIDMLHRLAEDLNQNRELAATIEDWKQETLTRFSLAPSIEALLSALKNLPEQEQAETETRTETGTESKSGQLYPDGHAAADFETENAAPAAAGGNISDADPDTVLAAVTEQRTDPDAEYEPELNAVTESSIVSDAAADTESGIASDADAESGIASAASPSVAAIGSGTDDATDEERTIARTAPPALEPPGGLASLRSGVCHLIDNYWLQFKEDHDKKQWIEGYIKSFLVTVIDHEHRLIGQIVRDTLNAFTEKRLIAFIEDKVGEDLSRIRINGSLVGAGIGALLYLFLHGVYAPLLQLAGIG